MTAPPLAIQGPRRLTRLYIIALSAVAALSIAGQVVVQFSLVQQTNDARVINLAGRQRMLSQRISKAALALVASVGEQRREYADELRSALALFRQSHRGLQEGDASLGLPGDNSPEVAAMFARLNPPFERIVGATEQLLAQYDSSAQGPAAHFDQSSSRLLSEEAAFLAEMDRIVFRLDQEAETRVARLRWLEAILLICTLVVLAAEGWLVFRPAVSQLTLQTDELLRTDAALRTAKELAESANRAKDQLLADVSHELRNPLQAIVGHADLLREELLQDARGERTEIILSAARAQLRLINDLLDASSLQCGPPKLEISACDPAAICQSCLAMLAPEGEKKGLALEYEGPPIGQGPLVRADPDRLLQLLWNLGANAVKFSASGKVVLGVRSDAARGQCSISVRDQGPGIAAHDLPHLFEPFYKGQIAGRRNSLSGMGLGLAIGRGLATAMGGELTVTSVLGEGSDFTLVLPLETANVALTAAVHVSSPGEPGKPSEPLADVAALRKSGDVQQVLLIDDDPINRRVLYEQLSSLGCQVVAAGTGAEALQLLAAGRTFAAVLSDLQMPAMDGVTLACKIRELAAKQGRPSPRLIAVSASFVAPAAGAYPFDVQLQKPIDVAQLERVLDKSSSVGVPARWSRSVARLGGDWSLLQLTGKDFLEGLPALRKRLAESADSDVTQVLHLLRGQAAALDAHGLVESIDSLKGLPVSTEQTAPGLSLWEELSRLELEVVEMVASAHERLA